MRKVKGGNEKRKNVRQGTTREEKKKEKEDRGSGRRRTERVTTSQTGAERLDCR